MDLRDSKSRLILIVVALGAALVIAVASCSGSGDNEEAQGNGSISETDSPDDGAGAGGEEQGDEDATEAEGDPDEAEPLAEVTGQPDLTLTITRAEREEGGFLTVEGTLHNGGGSQWFDLRWAGAEEELAANGASMAGATLIAPTEGKRYLILRDTTGRCLCTGFGSGIAPGATVPWFAQFPAPDPATTEVEFQVADMPPATIEIR